MLLPGPTTTINAASLVCSILLGFLLIVAACAKIYDRRAFRDAVAAFGLRSIPTMFVFSVPAAEALIGASLVAGLYTRATAVMAFVLLSLFTVIVTSSVMRGDSHQCNCFGALAQSNVSWRLVYRNVGLILAAIFVFLVPAADMHHVLNRWALETVVAHIVGSWLTLLSVVVFLQSLVLVRIIGQQSERARSFQSPVSETKVAPVIALGVNTGAKNLQQLVQSSPKTLMVFISPTCKVCEALSNPLKLLQSAMNPDIRIILLSHGDIELNRSYAADRGYEELFVLPDRTMAQQLGIMMTPSAVIAMGSGIVRPGILQGVEEILEAIVRERGASAGTMANEEA